MQLPAPPSSRLETAILLTVLYSDLFDHALTDHELGSYLVAPADPGQVRDAIEDLARAGSIERSDGHVVWRGRLALIPLRRERRDRSLLLFGQAREVADRLRQIPFLRMVGVCGSLAVENVPEDGDIDLFLVTENDRLWIVQWRAMSSRRRAARRGIDICPNYLISLANLEVKRRDLHTAREIAHVVPLWGEQVYDRFLEANSWVFEMLPNLDLRDRRRYLREPDRGPRTELWEARLRGRLGDTIDRGLHRLLLLYYSLRLRSRGIRGGQIRNAYRRDRQEVVGGGYAAAIRELFLRRVREELGDEALEMVEERLFPNGAGREDPVALYGRQLAERYGERI